MWSQSSHWAHSKLTVGIGVGQSAKSCLRSDSDPQPTSQESSALTTAAGPDGILIIMYGLVALQAKVYLMPDEVRPLWRSVYMRACVRVYEQIAWSDITWRKIQRSCQWPVLVYSKLLKIIEEKGTAVSICLQELFKEILIWKSISIRCSVFMPLPWKNLRCCCHQVEIELWRHTGNLKRRQDFAKMYYMNEIDNEFYFISVPKVLQIDTKKKKNYVPPKIDPVKFLFSLCNLFQSKQTNKKMPR